MKFIIAIIFFLMVMLITITTQCNSNPKPDKPVERKFKKVVCNKRLNNHLQLSYKNYRKTGLNVAFLSELCTETHRLEIYRTTDLNISKSFTDDILFKTFDEANSKIALFKNSNLSGENVFRLQRDILEDAFFVVYESAVPKSISIKSFVKYNKTEGMISNMESLYDNDVIKILIMKTEEDVDLLMVMS